VPSRAARVRVIGGRVEGAKLPPMPRSPTKDADLSPNRYIEKVNRATGREIPGPIDPDDLLVHAHRDQNPIEVAAQVIASGFIRTTGRERAVERGLKAINEMAGRGAELAGLFVGGRTLEKKAKDFLGVVSRDYSYRFREPKHVSPAQIERRLVKARTDAARKLASRGADSRLHVLLTGATGFLGKEILFQAATDRRIARLTAIVRSERITDRKTGEVLRVIDAAERGSLLLRRLGIAGDAASKFDFVQGDIEEPNFGLSKADHELLAKSVTHVIHCAASVSFDDPYEASFRSNVLGSINALGFSLSLQSKRGAPFVEHVAIETSYIHGRKRNAMAQEEALVFPRHFYNNFYELTKAMASMETDRHLIEKGLRVVQLLPSIVIGHSETGNNRGDTKVVNAPVNAFGRAKEIADKLEADITGAPRRMLLQWAGGQFPGDPTAELNFVPVDRVVQGIMASLTVPEAIGTRIHLATDNRIRSDDVVRTVREELGVNVRLSDPTIYRNVTLPIVKSVLTRLGEDKLANALEKLGAIFGGYAEWGQPVHSVGNDVRLLGLPIRRPDTENAFRMLCRHNRFVQQYGRVRDADEVARRESAWEQALARIEVSSGHQAGALRPREFRERLAEELDLESFTLRREAKAQPRATPRRKVAVRKAG
jgi:nucleoside-diphosphate-sugar epimerase